MGSCTSATKKKENKNKIIISNSLKNKNKSTLNKTEQNQMPNSLSIIINKIPNDTLEETQDKTPISIGQNMTFKDLFIQLHYNIYNDYNLQIKKN